MVETDLCNCTLATVQCLDLEPVLRLAPLIPAGMEPFHRNPLESTRMAPESTGMAPESTGMAPESTGMAPESTGMDRNPQEWTKIDILEPRT